MHFTSLALKNFGPFRDIAVDFPPTGVSVISGPNASGKSQLVGNWGVPASGHGVTSIGA